jgi:peptidoglycan hydrolase-like protein with peptidoglycan-binding domain
MSRFIALSFACILGLALIVPGAALAAEIALVIGNRDYAKAPNAKSAEIDAREVAAALRDGGYDVTLGIDLNRREMRNQISRFARKIGNADRVVVYFSGHALRSNGVTYLTPVDQQNGSLVQVMMDGVPLDLVLRLAETRAGRAVVFIDAAQFNGFTPNAISEPGLARIKPGEGVLVVSAAAPGQAVRRRGGRASRFARDVIREFLSPGARAMDAARNMRDPAWSTGSVRPKLRLVRRGGGGGGVSAPDTPAQIEAALALSSAQRRDAQESLSLLGHDPRGIDGKFGPGTRTAIRLWQSTNSLTETGYLTAEQITLLHRQSAEASSPEDDDNDYWARTGARGTGDGYRDYLSRYTAGLHAGEARDALKQMAKAGTDAAARRERQVWRDAKFRDRPSDYRAYLELYPTGIWQPRAEERLADLAGAGVIPPAAAEDALGLTRNDRLSIEQRLNYLGFPPGTQDGFFDSSTRWAIEGYQRNRGFEPTGYLDQPVIARIVEETGGVSNGIVIDGATVLRNLLRGLD